MSPDTPGRPRRPRIVALAGGTGTGKTTLAKEIAEHFGPGSVALVQQDHYYRDRSDLPLAARDALNFDHPDAIEFDLLAEQLRRLAQGETVPRPHYDFATHTRAQATTPLPPAPLILVEGILILHPPALRKLFDLKIHLRADEDVMLRRRAARDVAQRGRPADENEIKPFEINVLPMHRQFVEPAGRHADLILDTTHPDDTLLQTILIRIQQLLSAD